MQATAEQFEVVADREHDTDDDEDDQRHADTCDSDRTDRRRSADADDRGDDQCAGRDRGAQRSAVELVECVGADADCEEEREHGHREVPGVDRSNEA